MASKGNRRNRPPPTIDLDTDDGVTGLSHILASIDKSEDETRRWVSICRVMSTGMRGGTKEAWLFDCEPMDMPALRAKLRDECGGGDYRVRIYYETAEGARLMGNYGVAIEAPARAIAPSSSAPMTPQQTDLAEILRAMQSANEKMMERLERALSGPQASPWSQMKEVAEAMNAMQALQPKPDSSAGLAMFQKGMEMALEHAGSKGGETSMLDVVRDLAPKLLEVAQEFVTTRAQQQQHQGAPALPGPRPVAPRAAQQPAPIAPAPAAGDTARPQTAAPIAAVVFPGGEQLMGFLVEKAKAGADPALYAEVVADTISDEVFNYLEQQPDILGALEQLFPSIVPYRAWFVRLIDELMAEEPTSPADNDDQGGGNARADIFSRPDGGGAGGNPGNAQSNAGPGAQGQG